MGIPLFFRWIVNRYPNILIQYEKEIVLCSNLYLDFNAIIHSFHSQNSEVFIVLSLREL